MLVRMVVALRFLCSFRGAVTFDGVAPSSALVSLDVSSVAVVEGVVVCRELVFVKCVAQCMVGFSWSEVCESESESAITC